MTQPAQGRVSQGFHSGHQAVDIVNTFRSPIVAPISGTVTAVGQMGSGTSDAGLVVQIGNSATEMHRLCHLDSYIVRVGDRVSEGQIVGYMGYTGYTIPAGINGTHLHWVMWKNGVRVDGRNYVTRQGVAMNQEAGTELYRSALFREPESAAAARQWDGATPAHALRAVRGQEWNQIKAKIDAYPVLQKAVSDLQTALTNERNKPPQTVIKEVEKIVEKPVEVIKEVEVIVHADEKKVVENWFKKIWNSLFNR